MRTRPAPAAADTAYDGGERPSKTQLKQQAHELQTLGLALAALPDDRFAAIAMPERLREAIAEYRRTRSHEGRRRQMQYVGKCVRLADPAPLREAVAAYQLGSARDTLALHEVERWRDELIADDGALDRWALTHPDTDLQRLLDIHAELEEAARTSDIDGFFEANQAFHQEVQLIADNRWLTQAITDLRKVIKLSRHHSLFIDGRIEQSLAEHRLILEALGRRDVGATEMAMREHISSGRRALAKIAAKREATA